MGPLDALVRRIQTGDRIGSWSSQALLLATVAGASAFMSNTTCTALFLPLGVALARGRSLPASRVLMPVAFASILGGSITLFGTSTNLIVSGLLEKSGHQPLGVFELAPVALPLTLAGLAYLWVAPKWLLPDRVGMVPEELGAERLFVSERLVEAASSMVGKTLAEAQIGRRFDLQLLAIGRAGSQIDARPDEILRAGDRLIVEGTVDNLLRFGVARAAAEPAEVRRKKEGGGGLGEAMRLIELVVLPRSELVGRSLSEVRFRQSFGASVVAIYRHAEPLLEKLADLRLRAGDVILVQGPEPALGHLLARRGLLVLNHRGDTQRPPISWWLAPTVFALVVVAGASGVLALSTAVLVGCLALFLSRCVTPQEAYAAVEWRLLILIAGMLAFGRGLETTGAAEILASALVGWVGDAGPRAVLATFYLLTLVLTQPMSNQAAALVVMPVALEVAVTTGIEPRALAITVALAASSSFLTPLEPSCLLVYSPGGYRFRDFPRLGLGLTILSLTLVLLLVPWIWPVR